MSSHSSSSATQTTANCSSTYLKKYNIYHIVTGSAICIIIVDSAVTSGYGIANYSSNSNNLYRQGQDLNYDVTQQLGNIFLYQDSTIFRKPCQNQDEPVYSILRFTATTADRDRTRRFKSSSKTAFYNQQPDCSVHIRFAIKTTK